MGMFNIGVNTDFSSNLGDNELGLGNSNRGIFTKDNFGYREDPPGPGTDYMSQLNSGLGSKSTDTTDTRTFAQKFYDTDETSLFGRSLIHNAANEIAAGKSPLSQDKYKALYDPVGAQPVVNAQAGATPGAVVTPTNTSAKPIYKSGSNYSDTNVAGNNTTYNPASGV